MLVLSRKVDETIRIGNGTVLTVVAIKGGKVRLGFETSETVLRGELLKDQPDTEPQNGKDL